MGAQDPAAPLLLLVLLPLLLVLPLLVLLPLLLVVPKPPLPLVLPPLLVLLPLLLPLPLVLPEPPLPLPDDDPPSSLAGNPDDVCAAHPATWTMAATDARPTSGTAHLRRRMGETPSPNVRSQPACYWLTIAVRSLMQSAVTEM